MKNFSLKNLLCFFFLVLIFVSCDIEVPVKELSSAHVELNKAISVNAKYYSNKYYLEAEKNYRSAHREIIVNSNQEKGLVYIKKSIEYSRKAYEDSKIKSLAYWNDELEKNQKKVEKLCLKKFNFYYYNKFKNISRKEDPGNDFLSQVAELKKINSNIENFINKIDLKKTKIISADIKLKNIRKTFFEKIKSYKLLNSYNQDENEMINLENAFPAFLQKENLCSAILNIQTRKNKLYHFKLKVTKERTDFIKKQAEDLLHECNKSLNKIAEILISNKDKLNEDELKLYNSNFNKYQKEVKWIDENFKSANLKYNNKFYGFSRKHFLYIIPKAKKGLLDIDKFYISINSASDVLNERIEKSILKISGNYNELVDIKSDKVSSSGFSDNYNMENLIGYVEVYFNEDKFYLSKDQIIKFKNFLKEVKGRQNSFVKIEAHSDQRGSEKYNFKLSKKRIKWVLNYLVKRGYSESNIKIINFGEKDPLFTTPKYYHLNRNVKISLYFK